MAPRLLQIDESNRQDHSYLEEGDDCYYVLEYTPRQGPHHSSTNDLIINLKKPVDRRGRPEYWYKEEAIRKSGDLLRSVLDEDFIREATLAPIPCSKVRGDPLYDPRMFQVLERLAHGLRADIRELVIQTENLESFHDGCRLNPNELREYYELDEQLCAMREPNIVAVFDDLLTTGSHFKAVEPLLRQRWPDVPVVGIFLARRYLPAAEVG